jgi:methylase of polypeptide subunit release factors
VSTLCASDICANAVGLTRNNAFLHGLKIDCRQGTAFEPWHGMKFDLIVEDVSAISEPIAQISNWYKPPIVNRAGIDGTRWIVRILSEAPRFLSDGGQIFFPVLSLSNEGRILHEAHRCFRIVKLHQEQWYPLSGDLLLAEDSVLALANTGTIRLEKKGSRWCWATRIYSAASPVMHDDDS